MTDAVTAVLHIDGAARGNPGPAAYAVVLARPGLPVVEEAVPIGTATNNVAEYTALVKGLELALSLGVTRAEVYSDSELMVKQMNGEYRVKNADLQDLYREATALRRRFDKVTLAHVRREQNKRADQIGNEALDGRPRRRGEAPPPEVPAAMTPKAAVTRPKKVVSDVAVREDAILCLESAAKAWAANGANNPPAAAVWDQLWFLLAEGGVLKTTKGERGA